MIKPFKYLIQPVALEFDGDRIVREVPAETVTVYDSEQARDAIEQFVAKLSELVANQGEPAANGTGTFERAPLPQP